jgi:hypothetical protein
MLIFPINTDTFKKSYLSGDGQLELRSDQDLWLTLVATGGKFLPTVTRVADLSFKFADEEKFRIGRLDGMRLSVGAGASHQIQLIWPDEGDKALAAMGLGEFLTDDKLYVRLFLGANGDLAADARIPAGALSATFGVAAGGAVAYERWKPYSADLSAKEILGDLFAGVRLPQQVDAVSEVPEPGEVLITRFGGYLKLNAGMNWGYALTGSRAVEFNQLRLDLNYALKLVSTASINYSLAGDFSIETRRGAQDGWARFVVRKSRDSQFSFAADFGVDGNVELKGLPQSADEFLIRLIGADAKTVLDYFHQAQPISSLDELEKKLTPMVKGFVHEWSNDLIGKALSDATLKEFLAAAGKVADAYDDLDTRILDLYHHYLDKIPQLQRALDMLAGISVPADLAESADSGAEGSDDLSAWDVAQLLWGTSLYPLLLQNEEFAKFALLARRARSFVEDDATKALRDFIAKLAAATKLDPLFDKLRAVQTPDQLKQLVDAKLQDLAGRLIGVAFDQLKASDLNDAVKTLHQCLSKIEAFKNAWYARLTEAVSNKFTLDLHYAYARSASDKDLVDVELNLNLPEGRELARAAAVGDFAGISVKYNPNCVKINSDAFTREVERSAQLQINVLGWGYDSLKQLSQSVDRSIEPSNGGLLHVYAAESSIRQRVTKGRKFKETVESNFLLRAVGDTFQPADGPASSDALATQQYLIQTLTNLAVQYDLLESDERASPEELKLHLDFAEFLGLFDKQGRDAFFDDLTKQFPQGFGKVSIQYVVRYDKDALREAFRSTSGDSLRQLALRTTRKLIGAKYTGMKQTERLSRIGFAYLSPSLHEAFDKDGFTALQQFKSVTLPAWFTRDQPRKVDLIPSDIQFLITLCMIERNYADRLVKLDAVFDRSLQEKKPIPLDELQDAARNFVDMADDLDQWRENAFFAIFDKVVEAALSGSPQPRVARESAMVLEITATGKGKVTKVLTRRL